MRVKIPLSGCLAGICIPLLLAAFCEWAEAQNLPLPSTLPVIEQNRRPAESLFPSAYFMKYLAGVEARESAAPYWVPAGPDTTREVKAGNERLILLNNDILAFYGHPLSVKMGILGRHSIEELDAMLTKLAEEYNAANGERGVRKAFYIIYGTAWPEGEIGIIQEETLQRYIQYGIEKDILVFIDHQIGRYKPVEAIKKLFPYLRYSNVHLALDPEWRTTRPMREIGGVTAEEINEAQQLMSDYMREQNIHGERILMIHQFNWRMIQGREKVKNDYEGVQLVHCADGFGSPATKRDSYAHNAQALNMPVKGFKLFYNFNIPGAGYDSPIMSPAEVFALKPRPYVIIYQ
ncbi:MAG: hypothetical protein LBU18_03730 [Treponema sp.]|jgi:hypothetical protein|nr:hypothetical protein [Treponema sp.]